MAIENINLNGVNNVIKDNTITQKIKTFDYTFTAQTIAAGARDYASPTNELPSNAIPLGVLRAGCDISGVVIEGFYETGVVVLNNLSGSQQTVNVECKVAYFES